MIIQALRMQVMNPVIENFEPFSSIHKYIYFGVDK